ncbi:MAG: HAD-IB family hydrolase [Patescibacteria group bacterium]|nr:HAD-IB family hydrolase [Patescibacteria group bacterium]
MAHLLAVFDLDGTLVDGYSQRYLLGFLRREGYIGIFRYAVIWLWFVAYSARIVDSPARILRYALDAFIGMKEKDVGAIFDRFFSEELRPRIYPGAAGLIEGYKRKGYEAVILSAAIDPIVARCADHLGADRYTATELVFVDGALADVKDPVYGGAKARWLERERSRSPEGGLRTAAFADHYSDRELLSMADEPHAVNPDRRLERYALSRAWPVMSMTP